MRFKKLLSAVLAGSMTASVMLVSAATPISAADEKLTFDLRSNGENTVTVSADRIAAGDVTVPVSVYVPENPGVFGINLKLQVNDGQVAEDGSFGNYGLYLTNAEFASPYCFDSANAGNFAASFSPTFNAEQMSIVWVNSQSNLTQNADAYAEAGTTAWSKDVSWAYDYAFVNASLVLPKDTPAGTYQLDIRKEKYINILTKDKGTAKYGQSTCKAAGESNYLEYESIPLTVVVEAKETTTTTTTTSDISWTTTTETTTQAGTSTSTTVSTTLSETTTSTTSTSVTTSTSTETGTTASTWKDDYKIEGTDHYLIIGDVCGAPGETVIVPVYVYNDPEPGVAGISCFFESPGAAKIVDMKGVRRNYAYSDGEEMLNAESDPKSYLYVSMYDSIAANGSILTQLSVKIPENAADGTVYPIKFYHNEVLAEDGTYAKLLITSKDGHIIPTEYYNGSVTVVSDGKTALNYSSYMFSGAGDYVNLTLFNAHDAVTWESSDPAVASVDENGFVTAKKLGSATVTATCGGQTYTCAITVGLFGDVDQNGSVDAADAQITLKDYVNILAGKESFLSDAQKKIADVTGNGSVEADDAQLILKYYVNQLAGKSTTWYEITKNPKAPGGPEA